MNFMELGEVEVYGFSTHHKAIKYTDVLKEEEKIRAKNEEIK